MPKRTNSIQGKEKEKEKKIKIKNENSKEEIQEYKWWLEEKKDDSIKWTTLSHAGPLFPPEYEPHGVKMKYNGNPIKLGPESEEIATFFAALLESDHAQNPTFVKNFFHDFRQVLKKDANGKHIKEFEKCDFKPIFEYLQQEREKKKAMTKDQKLVLKQEKEAIDEVYGFCLMDGRKEKVGNFRIEPPGLFRGRGEHPKTGCLKQRVSPEQVTINIGQEAKIPQPPDGHSWGKVIHDPTVTWLAMWKENVNDSFKYIFLAATSSLKGQSDLKKFEKARELKKCVKEIRENYERDLKDEMMIKRQLATCLYFIDRLALRAGNEKGDDEADTVGCCSLRVEHITLQEPDTVIFDFLGKDSIRYYNEVKVTKQVYKNLAIFKRAPKKEGDDLFDRVTTTLLNKQLNTMMAGLTAKVFRTFNASYTFQQELKKTPADGTIQEKILAYNRANREVAVLCNHQRAIPKTHGAQMERAKDKILAIKYDRKLVKEQMLEMDPSLKKSRKELLEEESDLDDEFIERHLKAIAEKEEEKLAKQLAKENEKRAAEGQSPLTKLEKKKTKYNPSMAQLEKKYDALTLRLNNQKMQMVDKDENKQTALGTSKINYIDPRISGAWCDKYEVPVEKIFNKTLRDKFKWALDVDKNFEF